MHFSRMPVFRYMAALALPTLLTAATMPSVADGEVARFGHCAGPHRTTCVVDGDTFWLRGQKIRIAHINTPETSQPACSREAALGAAATDRLIVLLNQGPFSLAAWPGRETDRYGRLLRVVTRGGRSIGERLTAEGLAEPWQGRRGNWCAPGA